MLISNCVYVQLQFLVNSCVTMNMTIIFNVVMHFEFFQVQHLGNWICLSSGIREQKASAQLGPLERVTVDHRTMK
jgi:hypothetical protein